MLCYAPRIASETLASRAGLRGPCVVFQGWATLEPTTPNLTRGTLPIPAPAARLHRPTVGHAPKVDHVLRVFPARVAGAASTLT
jgi:hypothetical protein